jgi:threonine dehydrogenase-like Zn-dependent dehydrogenase
VEITGVGADVVIVCVRGADVLRQSMTAARREGTIAIVGFPKPAELDPIYWLEKHLKIIGCEPFLRYNVHALKMLEYKRIDCRPLMSAVMPLADVQQAFDSLYQSKNTLVMLQP